MHAQWTAGIIGKMHLYGITAKQLADSAGWHPKYLSAVLNGHRNPKCAEEKLSRVLDSMIERRQVFRDPPTR